MRGGCAHSPAFIKRVSRVKGKEEAQVRFFLYCFFLYSLSIAIEDPHTSGAAFFRAGVSVRRSSKTSFDPDVRLAVSPSAKNRKT